MTFRGNSRGKPKDKGKSRGRAGWVTFITGCLASCVSLLTIEGWQKKLGTQTRLEVGGQWEEEGGEGGPGEDRVSDERN